MKVNYEMRLKNSEKKITYIHVYKFSPPFPPPSPLGIDTCLIRNTEFRNNKTIDVTTYVLLAKNDVGDHVFMSLGIITTKVVLDLHRI
jgi:hypothetical protein